MKTTRWTYGTLLALAVAGLLITACKRESPSTPATEREPVSAPAPATPPAPPAAVQFSVTSVELGKAVDTDKRITLPADIFAPGDTIYASIVSQGSTPEVSLAARWTFEDGQLIDESTQVIAPTGPAATEFHIARSDGLPAGRYKLEVSANGSPVATKEFTVQ